MNDDHKLWRMAKARVAFKAHFRKYLLVNGLLWCIWLLVDFLSQSGFSGIPWPIYPTVAWGIAIFIHYYNVYLRDNSDPIKREYDKLKKSKDNDLTQD